MPLLDVEPLEASLQIAAPPSRVWALVSDPRAMRRWSPQLARTFLLGGGPVREGTRMLNVNRRGLLVWPTRAEVVRLTPEREIAWRVRENYTVWSYRLEPAPGSAGAGTWITSRREAPHGISDLSVRLTDWALGGEAAFSAEMVDGMQRTLEAIRADAER